MPERKRTNNDRKKTTTQKTKDRATRTPLKVRCSGWVGSSCSTSGTRQLPTINRRRPSSNFKKYNMLQVCVRMYC